MALHCHIWLVLLASIFPQCGAIEYYVKPTDFSNDNCPGQPCLTINEYTNASVYNIKSNTVFKFLPGKHIVKRPIILRDVQNISLAAISGKRDTKIATAHYMCRHNNNCPHNSKTLVRYCGSMCCSVIGLINVTHVSIISLTIETNSSGIAGVTIQRSRNVHIIDMDVFCTVSITTNISSENLWYCGIVAFKSNHLFVNGMQASQHSSGIVLLKTNNVIINNSFLMNSLRSGVHMNHAGNVRLLNTIISNNHNGMYVFRGRNTRMENINFTHNKYLAKFFECLNTHIYNRHICLKEFVYKFSTLYMARSMEYLYRSS